MYWKLSDKDKETIERISKITGVDYELKGNLVPIDSLIYALFDMLYEYDVKEEELEDLKQDLEDNYKPIPVAEQVGISDRDFL